MSTLSRITPRKPKYDDRDYRIFVLGNGMQVAVVSDTTTEKAAAALAVDVGSQSDPPELPGLAHFLEHMLFLGTKKYPEEGQYRRFLGEHAGSCNASTANEVTTYHFEVAAEHLEHALDLMSQFFITPLFTASATDRELCAVDSEHSKNLQSDGRQEWMLLKANSTPHHPFSRFGSGNFETLRDGPARAGVDVRAALLAFHEKHYSASVMRLAVVGRESVDELEALARRLFDPVPTNGCARPSWPEAKDLRGLPFCDATPQILRVCPLKDLRSMKMMFPMPPMWEHYTAKPDRYLSHLLGHEGPGSVLSVLRRRQWATGLSAGGGARQSDFMWFSVSVDLTEEGLSHVDEIVRLVFQYVNLLRASGVVEWVHTELATMAATKFCFLEKSKPVSAAQGLVDNMRDYPATDALAGDYVWGEFRPDIVREVLSYLRPNNVRVLVKSKTFEGTTNQTEQWYKARYSRSDIPAATLESWENCGLSDELSLPEPNEFVPTDLELKAAAPGDGEYAPRVAVSTLRTKLWFKHDTTFCRPRAYASLHLASPLALYSPRNHVLCALYARMLEDALQEPLYAATVAGLHYGVGTGARGLTVDVHGFNDKLGVLVRRVLNTMLRVPVEPERFHDVKDKLRRKYDNEIRDPPYDHCKSALHQTLHVQYWTTAEKRAEIDGIEPADLVAFAPLLLSELYLEGLFHGNVTEADAIDLARDMEDTLQWRALPANRHPNLRHVALDAGHYLLRRPHPNVDDVNSAIVNHYQIGVSTPELAVPLLLLIQIGKDRAFQQLRTTEQLGYIVWMTKSESLGVLALAITIQSATADPAHIDGRIEAFVATLQDALAAMTDKEFGRYVRALEVKLTEKDRRLEQEFDRHWSEILNRRYIFDRVARNVAVLHSLTREAMIAFVGAHVADSVTRRKISSQIYGNKHPIPESGGAYVSVTDPVAFKQRATLFPVSC